MAHKKSSHKEEPKKAVELSKTVQLNKTVEPKATKKEVKETKPAPVQEVRPPVTFIRWFKSKGFKSHWQRGMKAFTNTSGRRTMEEWDQIFSKY